MAEGLTDAQIVERLQRLERNVRMLAEKLGVDIEDPAAQVDLDIVALAQSGDRMGAAKLYRERTGVTFPEAQQAVNSL
jgi:ribosomal protein L7/L12